MNPVHHNQHDAEALLANCATIELDSVLLLARDGQLTPGDSIPFAGADIELGAKFTITQERGHLGVMIRLDPPAAATRFQLLAIVALKVEELQEREGCFYMNLAGERELGVDQLLIDPTLRWYLVAKPR
jgi:hypothetical protein